MAEKYDRNRYQDPEIAVITNRTTVVVPPLASYAESNTATATVELFSEIDEILEAARLRQDLKLPEEDAEKSYTYFYVKKGHTAEITVETTLRSALEAMSAIFIMHGNDGMSNFLIQARRSLRPPGVFNYNPQGAEKEEFRARIRSYRMLIRARRLVRDHGKATLVTVEKRARVKAAAKLELARDEILNEVLRYYMGGASASAGNAATLVAGDTQPAMPETGDAVPLIGHVRESRRLWSAYKQSENDLESAASRVAIANPEKYPIIGVDKHERRIDRSVAQELAKSDPSLALEREAIRRARQTVTEYMMTYGPGFPLLWRLYESRRIKDTVEEINSDSWKALTSAYNANMDLFESLTSDPEDVWKLPPLIRATVRDSGTDVDKAPYWMSETSIGWRAVQDRLAEENGLRLVDVLSISVGITHLAAFALAFSGGVALGMIGVVFIVVDIFLAIWSIIEEILTYLVKSAAYDAVLNPTLALGHEASWIMTALFVTIDLITIFTPIKK